MIIIKIYNIYDVIFSIHNVHKLGFLWDGDYILLLILGYFKLKNCIKSFSEKVNPEFCSLHKGFYSFNDHYCDNNKP